MEEHEVIELLCSKGHRGSCTTEERWAAREIEDCLKGIGLHTSLQEFRGHRTYGEKLSIHLIPALVLSVLALVRTDLALLCAAFILFLTFSFLVECIWLIDVASRMMPKKQSVNVLAREENEKAEKRILFVAHHDSQKQGQIFNPKLIDLMKSRFSATSRITPIHLTFLGIVGLMLTSTGFFIDLDGTWMQIHLLLHISLLGWGVIATALVLEWTLSKTFVPGANDNASGVAVMLGLAGKLSGKDHSRNYGNIEFWYLSTGCEETGMGGALAFIREHGNELRGKPTSVLCLDVLGYGNIHYFTADGILFTRPYDSGLITIARDLMMEQFGKDRSFVCRVFTDGLAFTLNGFSAITFGSLDKQDLVQNYHWISDTPENIDPLAVAEAMKFMGSYIARLAQ